MDLPETLRIAILHALSWTALGLLVLATFLMTYHYLTELRRYS